MRPPEYTETHYRRLRVALAPFRVAVCVFALWTAWTLLELLDRPVEPTGSMVGDLVLAVTLGLLIGVNVTICVIVAVAVWYPLAKPEGVR